MMVETADRAREAASWRVDVRPGPMRCVEAG